MQQPEPLAEFILQSNGLSILTMEKKRVCGGKKVTRDGKPHYRGIWKEVGQEKGGKEVISREEEDFVFFSATTPMPLDHPPSRSREIRESRRRRGGLSGQGDLRLSPCPVVVVGIHTPHSPRRDNLVPSQNRRSRKNTNRQAPPLQTERFRVGTARRAPLPFYPS